MMSPDKETVAVASEIELDREGVRFGFQNSYARLPERFYARLHPTPVVAPCLVKLNVELARELGLDPGMLSSQRGVEVLSGNYVAEGAEPLAIAYAGHQFGHYVPLLGDGRANLLGEVLSTGGMRYDIQLKGSGPTPFSRRGDGRAALGPVLREYLVSEWMAAVGVPTTRALAAVLTGDKVYRETVLPGAVLTRIASSHLRVGTFQYFTARGDVEGTQILADYAIARHYPDAAKAERPVQALLDGVIERQAKLVAQWMLLGFVHGVMNTDNTSISGETIDYGPCAFMEAYHPGTVFSFIDQQGRYAYGNQPLAMQWNLSRLAEALLPLLKKEWGSEEAAIDAAHKSLEAFEKQYASSRLAGFRRKLGLSTEQQGDESLIDSLLEMMSANRADFTSTFRRLYAIAAGMESDDAMRTLFADSKAYDDWTTKWLKRLQEESAFMVDRLDVMNRANPAFIPRNHLVEAALDAATKHQDFAPFEKLSEVLSKPFEDQPGNERFGLPALPSEQVTRTFCGT